LTLWDEVDHYGNLHVWVEDGNLEDCYFEPEDAEDPGKLSGPRQSIEENIGQASAAEIKVEERLLWLLEQMTEAERFSCYETCMECRVEHYKYHGLWVADGEDGETDDGDEDTKVDLLRRALAIIAHAICHGMPVTQEVADVRNGICDVLRGAGEATHQ